MIQPMELGVKSVGYDLYLPQCAGIIRLDMRNINSIKVLRRGRWITVQRLVEDLLIVGRRS